MPGFCCKHIDGRVCHKSVPFLHEAVSLNSPPVSSLTRICRRLVGRLITRRQNSIRKALKHLGPVIEERYRAMADYGSSWSEKPVSVSIPRGLVF